MTAIENIGRKMSGGSEVGKGHRDDGTMYALDRAGRHGIHGEGLPSDSCAFDPRPDGPRYAACGDAVTVNVSHWIGKRLMEFA